MICRNCGTTIADKAIVCFRCGTPTDIPVPARKGPPQRRSSRARLVAVFLLFVLSAAAWQLLTEPANSVNRWLGWSCVVLAVLLIPMVLFRRRPPAK